MKKLILLALPVLLCAATLQAQQITGSVKDETGKALSGATITLKKVQDSAIVKLATTDTKGQYSFTGIAAGKYFVAITFVGYVGDNSFPFDVSGTGDVTVPDVSLIKTSADMAAVTVTARKPMIEVKADKTILNVEGTVNSVGQDALELLRKAPGVMVDKDDNLSLSGKNGVQVYIDGRPTPLAGKDLSDYLKTIQSSSVESIEIITNPSAKYDAAGNAGIINIKLKKNKNFGTNGSLTAGYNQGITPKYNGGISLNHRDRNINLFGNYNFNENRMENNISLYRIQKDTLFDQKSNMHIFSRNHSFKTGADYTINRKNVIGVMVNGTFSDNEFTNYSRTPISYNGVVDRILIADNESKSNRKNINANLNYRFADTSGHELTMDADYGMYRIESDQFQPNFYFDPSGQTQISSRIYNMLAPTDIDIYSFKTDYEQNFKGGKLGFGGKVSYVESGNDFYRYDVVSSVKKLDTLRSNDFVYKENINAAYINYNRPFKGFMVQVGLRMENTIAKGRSTGYKDNGSGGYVEYDSTFERNYTNFFPSAAITFNKKPTSQWSFTYSRRIDRPAYQNLNPFEFKLDEYTFQKGNTELTPQYTNSFGVTHTYKFRLNTTLNYSHVTDILSQIVDTAEASKAFLTQKNLATQDIVSLNISYPFQYKWYSIFGNLNAYYSHFKSDFGPGRKVDLGVYAVNIYAQQTFRLGKGWTAEMSGFYNSPSIWQGTFKSIAMWSIDAGLQKTVFKGKGNLKVSVSDVFKTLKWKGISNFSGQYLEASGNFESRQLKVFFTWRFGNSNVKAARQRKTGTEEESKRVGSQGGGIGQ